MAMNKEDKSNLFDLDNLSDIPKELRGDLRVLSRDAFEKQIIELFVKANRNLNIDEVMVGHYRRFGSGKDRSQILTRLYNMSRSGRPSLVSVKGKNNKGVYKYILEENGDELVRGE